MLQDCADVRALIRHNRVLYVAGLLAVTKAAVDSAQAELQTEGPAMIYGGEQMVEVVSRQPTTALLAIAGPPLAIKAYRAMKMCQQRHRALHNPEG